MQDKIDIIRSHLSPDLLKKAYRNTDKPLGFGHCYVASEALYYILKKEGKEWFPVRARDEEGIVHWWLENPQGEILDPTSDQYLKLGKTPPYDKGKRGGFLTKEPSKRTRLLLSGVEEYLR